MPSAGKILADCVRQYCYLRERKYCPFDDLNDFWYVVKVKENAPQLLWRGLSRAAVDVVATGDYQAAEKTFEASRRTLEVCPELDNAAGQRVGRTRRRRGRSRSCLPFGRATGAGRGADLSDDGAGQAEGLGGIENVGPGLQKWLRSAQRVVGQSIGRLYTCHFNAIAKSSAKAIDISSKQYYTVVGCAVPCDSPCAHRSHAGTGR